MDFNIGNEIGKLLFQLVIPAIITTYLPILLQKGVTLLNQKQDLINAQITIEQEEFLKQKAIEGINLVYEKAWQHWKSDDKEELTSDEKLELAQDYVLNSLDKDLPIAKEKVQGVILSTLADIRQQLDNKYNDMKRVFVKDDHQPENSRPPF